MTHYLNKSKIVYLKLNIDVHSYSLTYLNPITFGINVIINCIGDLIKYQ